MTAPPASGNKGSLSVVRPANAGSAGMFETFISITTEGSVTAFNGHVDLGTGIRTALGQIRDILRQIALPLLFSFNPVST